MLAPCRLQGSSRAVSCIRSANAGLLDGLLPVVRGRTAGFVPVVPYRILQTRLREPNRALFV
jgi:hypothetical protein